MRLTAFQSDKGDCLLLESRDGKRRMLVDGGMRRAYREHVAPELARLRAAGKALDVVYVSHIDQDHIAGVLELLDDEAAWRVHDHQTRNGNRRHPAPDVPRPPEVRGIFHNSFHDQVGENSGPVQDLLAATAGVLAGAEDPWLREVASARMEIATSVTEALRVSHRIAPGQLGIPLNAAFDGKLMMADVHVPRIEVGSIELKIVGPRPEDLSRLRDEWDAWLDVRKNRKTVEALRRRAREDADDMTASEVDRVIAPIVRETRLLGAEELALADRLGDRGRVTAPNLASLMFYAAENGQSVLLTGDGHADDILAGLAQARLLGAGDRLHVDVLKVQHHGSENNIHQDFCDRVTAGSYLFCGNGEHENPDLEVLELIFDRRMAADEQPFRFGFNSSSKASVDEGGREHMRKVEELVQELVHRSQGRLTAQFIAGHALRVL